MDSCFSIAGRHIDKFRWIVVAPKDKELHIDVDPLVNHAVSGDRRPLGQGRPARREARADGRHRSVFPDAPHRGRDKSSVVVTELYEQTCTTVSVEGYPRYRSAMERARSLLDAALVFDKTPPKR
jgi:hypothetical protein